MAGAPSPRQCPETIVTPAAARRHGAVAYVLPDRLDALLEEITAGHPVVVLQNLGLQWIPSWH